MPSFGTINSRQRKLSEKEQENNMMLASHDFTPTSIG